MHDQLVSHRAAISLLSLTRRFLAFLDERKRILGVVDFDDLLLRTLALLDDEACSPAPARSSTTSSSTSSRTPTATQARIVAGWPRDAGGALRSREDGRRRRPEAVDLRLPPRRSGNVLPADQRDGRRTARSGAPSRPVPQRSAAARRDQRHVRAALSGAGARSERVPAARTRRSPQGVRGAELDARFTLLAVDAETIRPLPRGGRGHRAVDHAAREAARDLQRFAILFRRLTVIDDYLDTLERYGIDYVLPPTRLFLDRPAPVDLSPCCAPSPTRSTRGRRSRRRAARTSP